MRFVALAPEREITLSVLHVNHQLRGDGIGRGRTVRARPWLGRLGSAVPSHAGPARSREIWSRQRETSAAGFFEAGASEARLDQDRPWATPARIRPRPSFFGCCAGRVCAGLSAIATSAALDNPSPARRSAGRRSGSALSGSGLAWREDSSNREPAVCPEPASPDDAAALWRAPTTRIWKRRLPEPRNFPRLKKSIGPSRSQRSTGGSRLRPRWGR